mmetsp:Transcript_41677/g.131235  ORF Transcript_41677/g.131235 Transcript_41677/m.131235 type:complete len:744 (+) Transcript_41677:333-2564(+)
MERFKEFERDSKTKQYSKEGLSKSDKVDPHEEERSRHRNWIQENIDKLHVQIDEIDADAESALSSKKGKNAKQDDSALQHLRFVQDTHRWHATKLEQLLRKLDNDDVALSELDDLRDSVEYYADENSRTAGEFQPFDTIYEAFGLEDVEDYLARDRVETRDRDDEKDDLKSVGTDKASEGSKSENRKDEETPKAPTKHIGGSAAKVRSNQRANKDDTPSESSSQSQKAWPPMVSVWQNPPPAPSAVEKEKTPPASSPGQPPKSGPSVPRPAPTLPPPMQPAPDRPPPPGQAPVLNVPPNQPPPKPAPPVAPHQMPQMQPPTQAPPQPPLPSPPVGSPPRPQGPPSSAATAGNSSSSTMPGMVSSMPMPAPPPMPPPAPQDGPAPGTAAVASTAGASQPPAAPQPAMSEPPATAPPPPPPPVLPPPPPSPVPAPSGPPATTPVLPAGHAKVPAPGEAEPAAWPPAVPCLPDEHLQSAPKVPPPSEAPPPPSESPPPPPPEVPGPTAAAEAAATATALAALETRTPTAPASSSSATAPAAATFEPGSGIPPPPAPGAAPRPPATAGGASSSSGHATRPTESMGLATTLEAHSQLSPRKLDALDLLAASHRHLPAPSDGRRNRKYVPRNPYVHTDQSGVAAYPMQPTTGYEDPAMFKKYDPDTLFFIFYYQQGSFQQHLAAKELKKLSWRFHTKFLAWFQRHEEPRMTAPDFERGAYVYFDHDTGWCQRIKPDFQFDYQFLEDEPM